MKTLRIFFSLFLGLGVLLLGIGAYTIHSTRQFLTRAARAPGVVIENVWQASSSGSGTYHPRIRFRTGSGRDVVFVSGTGSRPPSYRPEEAVEVVYDPDNPEDASVHSFWSLWLGTVILFGVGTIFTLVGAGPLAWQRRQRAEAEWLRTNGQRIHADFQRVELNTSIRVNSSHPYRIVAQCLNPLTNQVQVFKSENLWFDPTPYIPGSRIEVLVDPNNYRRYVVETGFLPRGAD